VLGERRGEKGRRECAMQGGVNGLRGKKGIVEKTPDKNLGRRKVSNLGEGKEKNGEIRIC